MGFIAVRGRFSSCWIWSGIGVILIISSPSLTIQAMLRYGQRTFYVIGGTTGFEYNMQVHRLCLSAPSSSFDCGEMASTGSTSILAKWTHELQGPECEHARYRHEAFLYNGKKIVVFGGGTRDMVTTFDKVVSVYVVIEFYLRCRLSA
jgi:hypothetical protein